jgi:hypothetical protein
MTAVETTRGRAPAELPGSAARSGPSAAQVWQLRAVTVLVVLLVLTQRIGLPTGATVTSLAIPLAYAFAGLSLLRGLLVVSRVRAWLFIVAVSAVLLTTAGVSWLGYTQQYSLTSLALLITLYVPWVLRAPEPHGAALVEQAGRTFVRTMLVLSAVGLLQLATQLVGIWSWTDHLRDIVPADFIVPGYNFDNELSYGVGTYKSTAFVLLEPSFLSQFCALAIIIGIMLRVRSWQLLLLAGGLGSAVSGTGIILLAVGAVLLVLRAPGRVRLSYLLVGVVAPVLAFVSPVGSYILARSGEFNEQGTSGDARFNAPYEAVWKALQDEPSRFLVGAGPGSVERIIPGARITVNGTDVLYSVIPKLAFEYGIVAGGLFALFLVMAAVDRAPWRVVPATMIVMIFVLSGALLQPQTAVLVWLLSGIGAASSASRRRTTVPSG